MKVGTGQAARKRLEVKYQGWKGFESASSTRRGILRLDPSSWS